MSAETLDMSARYRVHGHGGVAFYLLGYAKTWTEETWEFVGGEGDDPDDEQFYVCHDAEEVEDRSRVRAVMVGDDHVWTFDVDDLEPLKQSEYCPECGQIGCTAYAGVYDDEEE